jgi:hypothetical protein
MLHPYFTASVCIALGSYLVWINSRQVRLNRYLRDHGVLTVAVIIEASLRRGKDYFISTFKAQYEDQFRRLHEAKFIEHDSNEEYPYLVGGEVLVRSDPLRPERRELAIHITSGAPYYGIGLGAAIIACGLYQIWEAQPHKHL